MSMKRILALEWLRRQGCEEVVETICAPSCGGELLHYTYRTADGRIFTTFAPSLVAARGNRDRWLHPRMPEFKIGPLQS